jgi:hypothetical protein
VSRNFGATQVSAGEARGSAPASNGLVAIAVRELPMARTNAFYAQSGDVTAVINASAWGVLQTARQYPEKIGKVYAGRNAGR